MSQWNDNDELVVDLEGRYGSIKLSKEKVFDSPLEVGKILLGFIPIRAEFLISPDGEDGYFVYTGFHPKFEKIDVVAIGNLENTPKYIVEYDENKDMVTFTKDIIPNNTIIQ